MENLGVILAVAGSTFTIVAAMIAMMLWVRSEANSDRRDIASLIREIQKEMRDFHIRLCAIEDKRNR